jgi:hypothetical protein
MPSITRVDEYRLIKSAGVSRIQTTGHGVRVYPEDVTYIYTAGIGYDGPTSHNVFTVYLINGRSFITTWAGIETIGSTVRVNEYAMTLQENGSKLLQYTDHGIRVNTANVSDIYTAGLGYELDGVTDHECFTVHMVNGQEFVTDWAGVTAINND